jgi:hypothetical protein
VEVIKVENLEKLKMIIGQGLSSEEMADWGCKGRCTLVDY